MFGWSLKSQNSSITKFYAGLLTAWPPESDNNLARKANNITIAGDSIPPYNWLIELKTVGSAAIRRKHPVFPCCWLQLITVRWKKKPCNGECHSSNWHLVLEEGLETNRKQAGLSASSSFAWELGGVTLSRTGKRYQSITRLFNSLSFG